MGNLHYRPKQYFITPRKSILKLVELPCLVAKCSKIRKLWPGEVYEFGYKCITHAKAYHFSGIIDPKVVGFRVRSTFVCKFPNFARPHFPHFTTFRNQTWQFY